MILTVYRNDISSQQMKNTLNHEFGISQVKTDDITFLGLMVWCNDELGYLSEKKAQVKKFSDDIEEALVFKSKREAINNLLSVSDNGIICLAYTECGVRNTVVLLDSHDFKKQAEC